MADHCPWNEIQIPFYGLHDPKGPGSWLQLTHHVIPHSFWLSIFPSNIKLKKVKIEVAQSCPTLCDPMDCSLPGSSLHGILQARVLEWVDISFSRGSSWSKDQTQVSHIPGRRFNLWATREAGTSTLPSSDSLGLHTYHSLCHGCSFTRLFLYHDWFPCDFEVSHGMSCRFRGFLWPACWNYLLPLPPLTFLHCPIYFLWSTF